MLQVEKENSALIFAFLSEEQYRVLYKPNKETYVLIAGMMDNLYLMGILRLP